MRILLINKMNTIKEAKVLTADERKRLKAIYDNLSTVTEETYKKLDEFMLSNSGLTSEECVKKIDFHNFTLESFENLIDTINKHRPSFYHIGPFKKNIKNDTWYNCKTNKLQTIKILLQENERLKRENEDLKKFNYGVN